MSNNNNGNAQPQGQQQTQQQGQQQQGQQQQAQTQFNSTVAKATVDFLQDVNHVTNAAGSIWSAVPEGRHTLMFGDKEVGFTKPTNYTGQTTQEAIVAATKQYVGEEASIIVDNNMSISSNFVPRKGAYGHFIATIGTATLTGVAAFFGGRAAARSSSESGVSTPDNVHEMGMGNQSYDHLNFG